jgi:pimeloyl-ACP methyl ester carboxylesterase
MRTRSFFISAWAAAVLLWPAGTVAAQVAETPPFPPPGRQIDIGGWRLHLHCTGLVRPEYPTVVLEAGNGAMSVDWALVQPIVARDARVCSYDRAGTGWSDLGPDPRTMRQIVWELRTLLERSGERLPVVLVGHSFGGALARQFAATYPTDVVGMVLVDAQADDYLRLTANGEVMASTLARGRTIPPVKTSDPLRVSDIPEAALQQIRSAAAWGSARANDSPRDRLPADAQRMRAWATAQVKHSASSNNPFEGDELLALQASRREQAHPLGDIPLIVLTRGNSETTGPMAQQHEERRQREQAELATRSRRGTQTIVPGTGHHIDVERPEAVAAAIMEVVRQARRP